MKAVNARSITDLEKRANGKATVVARDVERQDRLQDTLALLKILAQSQESLAANGRTYSSAEIRCRARNVLDQAFPR